MTKIYACLTGNWVCLNDDSECVIGNNGQSPTMWWKEGAEVWAPASKTEEDENTYTSLNYVHVRYLGTDYRINPIFIQIVDSL